MVTLASLLLASVLVSAGCTLVDQRTVARLLGGRAAGPSPADLAGTGLPALPLVTVRFDQPDIDPTPLLAEAAEAALSRKANAVFDVVTAVPVAAARAEQDDFIRRGAEDARFVAEALATAGVPPDQIRLGLRGDAGEPAREVRVYVR